MKKHFQKSLLTTFLMDPRRPFKLTCWIFLFLIECAFCYSPSAFGQIPGLINYSIREGLPSAEVYEVFQDSRGFIWFATDQGVAKFDGHEMKVLTVKDGLTDPVVFGFTEDEKNRIWFRTYSGKFSVFENGKIKPFLWNDKLEELVQNNLTYSLLATGDELQFSTERFIGKINSVGTIEKEEIKKNELVIKITPEKKLLYGFHGSSRYIKKIKVNDQYYSIALSDTIHHNKVISGLQDGDKTIISVNSDLFVFNGDGIKKVFTGKAPIISLSKDRKGFYWIGYLNHGVDKLRQDNYTLVDYPTVLSSKSITKVLQDHEGGMWFSTLEEGVYYTSNMEIKTISLKDKTRFATFNSNYGIIGDQKGFVSAYDLSKGNLIWEKYFDTPTRSLFIDNKNQVWISTNQTSIVSLEAGTLQFKVDGSYTGYSTDSIDFSIWAVGGTRISRFKSEGNSDYLLSNSIHLKILTENSKLYTSGRTGLEIFDSKMNLISEPTELVNSKITSIIPLDKELIFIGTIGNGFHLLNKNTDEILSFNADKRLIANDIYYAQKKDSLIWISTEKGILAIGYKSLKDNHLKLYKILSNEFQHERINFFQVTKQAIWTVSDYSIKIIPIKNEVLETFPLFYYDWILPQVFTIDKKVELTHNDKLQLKFGFISFHNQNIFSRYRISKKDNWTEATSRIINVQSISPGNYSLDIEFSLDNENWKAGASLPFLVRTPWWSTWYFRTISGLIILLVGFLAYKLIVARYKEKNEYLALINDQQKKLLNAEIETTERERSRIAKDLHDGIGMDLVTIKLMTNQLAKKTGNKDTLEIQSQLQKTISEIQNIIYGLTPSGLKLFGLSYGLENYVSMVKRNHPIEINFNFQGQEIKDQQIGAVVYRIIQELVTNSIKHSQCKIISIDINVFSSSCEITYHDNGIGFDPEHINLNPGLGLSNIRSRVESLTGEIHIESGSIGTKYVITLPLKR